MSYGALVERSWQQNILLSVMLELTYRCNLDCFFCYNDLGLRGRPLSLRQYRKLLDDLQAMQVMNVTLTGGEPLAHPHFFALGAGARQRGFVVRIKSNGHALRGSIARRIREEIDPFVIETSLHGATAASHDRQTRRPGSFARLMANLDEMHALGLRVKLNATLTAWNEHEVEAMYALADQRGLPLQMDSQVTPRDDGDMTPLKIAPSRQGIRRMLQAMAARHPAPRPSGDRAGAGCSGCEQKSCGAGSVTATVDPFGNVYPCVQFRRRVGSLHDAALSDIWSGSAALAGVRQLAIDARQKIEGRYGPDGALMGFCMGLAEEHTGDPLAVYAGAEAIMRLRREELLPPAGA